MLKSLKNAAKKTSDVICATSEVGGKVVKRIVRKPFFPVLIGTAYALKKYTNLGGVMQFGVAFVSASAADIIADEVAKKLTQMENKRAFENRQAENDAKFKSASTDDLIDAVKAEHEAHEDLKASTVEVIKDMQTPLTMEEQYEAAIDAALKTE